MYFDQSASLRLDSVDESIVLPAFSVALQVMSVQTAGQM